MLKKFFNRAQGSAKTSHPLGSEENLRELLGGIPWSDPERGLFEIAEWIDGIERFAAQLAPAELFRAAMRLDEFAHPAFVALHTAYLTPGNRHYLSERAWGTLEAHTRHVFAAHRYVLSKARTVPELAADLKSLALCATRAMLAWLAYKRLQHFRYRVTTGEWWAGAHELLALARSLKVQELLVLPYPADEVRLNVRHCHLLGIYLETAPLGNLIPAQIEALDGFLVRQAATLQLFESPQADVTHRIELDANKGPVRIGEKEKIGGQPGAGIHYCSVRKLHRGLIAFAAEVHGNAQLPEWVESIPCTRDQLDGLIKVLVLHWSSDPPRRSSARQELASQLRVVHGFKLARRVLAFSNYAREGQLIEYDVTRDQDYETFDEMRFGRTGSFRSYPAKSTSEPNVAQPGTPLEVLEGLETAGDKLLMERWQQVDSSETGLGAIATGLRSVHGVRGLICYRLPEEIDWRVAIIRRIGRQARDRTSIGVEKLPAPSLCAGIRVITDDTDSSTSLGDFADAILVAPGHDELLIEDGHFAPDLVADLAAQGRIRRVVLCELIEQGVDHQRVRFKPYIPPDPQK